MTNPCLEIHELAGVAAAPASDPRRLHAETCPRCRTLLAQYRSFERSAEMPAGARLAEAEERLEAMLAREGIAPARGRDPAAGRAAPGSGPGPRWRSLLLGPRARPAFAFAAMVIVAGLVFASLRTFRPAVPRGTESPPRLAEPEALPAPAGGEASAPRGSLGSRAGGHAPGSPLRGEDPGAAGGFELREAAPVADGLLLRWSAHPAAERYEVILYGADLAEIARIPAGADTSLVLGAANRPAALAPGTTLVWRVAALRGGDEVTLTGPGALRLP